MRKLRLIAILSALVFLIGCSLYPANQTNLTPHEWAAAELHKYWDSYSDIETLDTALIASGFKYGNELNDISFFFDTAPPAEKTMSRGFGNCYAYSRYFADFVKYKSEMGIKIVDGYEMYFLKNGIKWHYITIFKVHESEFYIEQSNLTIGIVASKQAILDYWYGQGFHYQEIRERWEVTK